PLSARLPATAKHVATTRNPSHGVRAVIICSVLVQFPRLAYDHRMNAQVHRERWRLLHQIVRLLEVPMMVLGLVWIVLLSIDMVKGLHGRLAVFSQAIWVLFALDFAA